MNHSDAVKLQAVERYLLGELTVAQRDQFEEHYFCCPECAADLKAAASVVESARVLLKTEFPDSKAGERAGRRTPWLLWFRPVYGMAAILVLLAVLGYENLSVMPRLRQQIAETNVPQALVSYSLVNSSSRGAGLLTIRAPSGRAFGLYVDIPPGPFARYVCEIRDDAERLKFSVNVSSEDAKETVQLLVPPSRLAPGRYSLVVRGATTGPAQVAQHEVARFPFALE